MTLDQIKAWLNEAARYFENRASGGEDSAHWANVVNAETARRAEAALAALEAERDALREALRPFADFYEKAEQFVADHAKDGGSPIMPSSDFRLSYFRRARAAMGETGK